tara:strand:+ start:365 stop:472 length:108 start_codon:yes stop_codon:yes gene_type:complete
MNDEQTDQVVTALNNIADSLARLLEIVEEQREREN